MMHPYELIGLPYRLGATPEKHGAADCLSLSIAVLTFYGISTPEPERGWYRRLRKGDTDVFKEELSKWGIKIDSPTLGAVALCRSETGSRTGLAMATFFEDGWISFVGPTAMWNPIGALAVEELYSCRLK